MADAEVIAGFKIIQPKLELIQLYHEDGTLAGILGEGYLTIEDNNLSFRTAENVTHAARILAEYHSRS